MGRSLKEALKEAETKEKACCEDEMPKELTDEQRECICYKSKLLNKYFDSYDELVEAEKKYHEENDAKLAAAETRKQRAHEVDEAFKKTLDARKEARELIRKADEEYRKLRNQFARDYGSYHMTYTNKDKEDITIYDLINEFFNW